MRSKSSVIIGCATALMLTACGGSNDNGGGASTLSATCQQILQANGQSYSCPTNAPSVSAIIDMTGSCIRDTYVAAAVTYCWAAYCYGQQTDDTKCTGGSCADDAQGAEQCALYSLCQSQSLCSDAPTFGDPACGEGGCCSLAVWSCSQSRSRIVRHLARWAREHVHVDHATDAAAAVCSCGRAAHRQPRCRPARPRTPTRF